MIDIRYIPRSDITEALQAAKHALQVSCFSNVSAEEIYEHFVAESIGSVLAWRNSDLVGCVSVFRRTIRFESQNVLLGGYGGTCTRSDVRRQGIGGRVCQVAMEQLQIEGCEVAMLAVADDGTTIPFYQRQGFRLLGGPFEIVTASGVRVAPQGSLAMIAPVTSMKTFKAILQGKKPLFLGPEKGYW